MYERFRMYQSIQNGTNFDIIFKTEALQMQNDKLFHFVIHKNLAAHPLPRNEAWNKALVSKEI